MVWGTTRRPPHVPEGAASGLETAAFGGAKRPAGGRYGTCPLNMHIGPRIAPGSTCGLLPTRRDPGAIPMGQYHQDLV